MVVGIRTPFVAKGLYDLSALSTSIPTRSACITLFRARKRWP